MLNVLDYIPGVLNVLDYVPGVLNCITTTSVSDPDPDPYQETLIWIRVAPKINQNHGINKSKWFVNVLFT